MIREIKADKVEHGSAVIANEFDKPETHMIAIVDEKAGRPIMLYLSVEVDRILSPKDYSKVTPVNDFGVRVFTDGKRYWVERFSHSVAKYPNGMSREWLGLCNAATGSQAISPPILEMAIKLDQIDCPNNCNSRNSQS